MKTFSLLLIIVAVFTMNGLFAQSSGSNGGIPLKNLDSPLFGKDIVVDNQTTQDQSSISTCSAYNGWLYAVTTSYDSVFHGPMFNLLRSTDNGITWSILFGGPVGLSYCHFRSNDILVTGDSVSNLKVFWAGYYSVSPTEPGQGYLYRFSGEGDFEVNLLFDNGLHSIALSSDFNRNSANNSSLGILYSLRHNNIDSIIFRSSSNGGMSFDNKKTVASSSSSFFGNVSLNYGRSLSFPNGRFFTAWEDKASQSSNLGHIFTSHSEPDINSSFTTPVCLDCVDPELTNKVRKPTIACQFNDVDNSSGNLTEMIICEKYSSSSNSYSLQGFYNSLATTSGNYNSFSISNTQNNCLQPSVNFNPYTSVFMVTYFDSTTKKLPLYTSDYNMAYPDSWNLIDSGYNDDSDLITPNPMLKLNFLKQDGMNVWIRGGNASQRVGMFDAHYSTYTGISEMNLLGEASQLGAYPNPCNSWVTIWFDLQKNVNVSIKAYTSLGQVAAVFTDQNYTSGKHQLKCNVSNLKAGSYILKLETEDGTKSAKMVVIR